MFSKFKGFMFLAFVLVGVGLLLAGCSGNQQKSSSSTIKVAVVGPMTGSQAKYGEDWKNSAILAIDEINAKGGIKGKKLEAVIFDDAADPKQAVSVAQKIVSDPSIVAVIGHVNSGCSIPASKIYAQANIPMLTVSTNPELTQQGLKNIFRVAPTDNVQGSFAADFLFKKGYKNIAILQDKSAYGQGVATEFKNSFEKLGGKVLAFEGVSEDQKDFSAILTKFKTLKPDAIYFGGYYPEGALITKQMRDLGMKMPLVGPDGLYDPQFLKIAGAAANGDIVTNIGLNIETNPNAKDFLTVYKAKYGEPGAYGIFAYEAVKILAAALEKDPTAKGEALIKLLDETNYNGVLGKTTFAPNGDTTNKVITVYEVKNEKFVEI
ncbi:branched-chain amino acid ABC transporter substrate-binding protein [Thermodesulfobium sp.]